MAPNVHCQLTESCTPCQNMFSMNIFSPGREKFHILLGRQEPWILLKKKWVTLRKPLMKHHYRVWFIAACMDTCPINCSYVTYVNFHLYWVVDDGGRFVGINTEARRIFAIQEVNFPRKVSTVHHEPIRLSALRRAGHFPACGHSYGCTA